MHGSINILPLAGLLAIAAPLRGAPQPAPQTVPATVTQPADLEPDMTFDFPDSLTLSLPHVKVIYHGISADSARMLGRILEAARQVYVNQFGFDMPEIFTLKLALTRDRQSFAFADRYSGVTMTFRGENAYRHRRGVVYGICHELGHVAMYRTLPDWDWISIANGEGWADYAGLTVFDELYKTEGHIWPAGHDYATYGMAGLRKQLATTQPAPDEIALGAGRWAQLEPLIGRKGYRKLLAAWQSEDIQLCRPEDAGKPLATAIAAFPDLSASLEAWWRAPGPSFWENQACSPFPRSTTAPDALTRRPLLIREDDNSPDGLKLSASSCPSRLFSLPGHGDWYLRAVSVYGQRYGTLKDLPQHFRLLLCDENMKVISTWRHHFSRFPVDHPAWVRLEVPPTRLPGRFYIHLYIDTTEIDGIRIGYDSSTTGHSWIGFRDYLGRVLEEGDWLIRPELDRTSAGASSVNHR